MLIFPQTHKPVPKPVSRAKHTIRRIIDPTLAKLNTGAIAKENQLTACDTKKAGLSVQREQFQAHRAGKSKRYPRRKNIISIRFRLNGLFHCKIVSFTLLKCNCPLLFCYDVVFY